MRKTCLEISRMAFLNNVDAVKTLVGNKQIMPVVKANGYGTYLNWDLALMNNFDMVAVAIVDEALQLRKMGYEKDIFVLNQPYVEEIKEIIDNNIVVGVSSMEFLKSINCDQRVRVHIEIETGMGRTGVTLEQLDIFITQAEKSNIIVEGVYTHLSSADIDYEFTNKQLGLFESAVNKLKKSFDSIKYVHCEASNGILNFDVDICNMVRPGIILYGYPSCKSALDKIKLEPVAKFRSSISYIKEIDIGDAISYGRSFVASGPMKVATVGCGYADGVPRALSNKGLVSVNGKRAKILGKVCMDSFMIDVTDIDVKNGDTVYLFDNELVTLDEVSDVCETINYEVLARISDRVPRKFID